MIEEQQWAEDSGLIFAGQFQQFDSYETKRPHGMKDWLVCYTLSGEGFMRTPNTNITCKAHHITVLQSGTPHHYGTVKGSEWHFLWAHFQNLPEVRFLPEIEVWSQPITNDHSRERIVQAFRHIIHDSKEQFGINRLLCENAIREILLLSIQHLIVKRDPRVQNVLDLLHERMAERLQIEDLARAVMLSPSRLTHLFKQETGESIIQHLNRIRINQAVMLMDQMGRTPSEAAQDVGFTDYNHFAALFRKQIGLSPRAYRNGKIADSFMDR
ncbi:helix-turn-helix domain-containing protein [Paenibacillus sp. 1001270B_150601_E10]|uniref:helix-turn-helix domain-containing protein n=1 Tax=Paenibacillus sp. 1001270B_150601_E10 TaxID=2787079 RepID=UPI00189CCE77|nr:helix-turn-helix domain-containing protein [Paenibacillus sp. 1001270B_150601_E10]